MYGAFSATPRSDGGLNAPSSRRPPRDERDRALVRVGVAERAETGEPAYAQLRAPRTGVPFDVRSTTVHVWSRPTGAVAGRGDTVNL